MPSVPPVIVAPLLVNEGEAKFCDWKLEEAPVTAKLLSDPVAREVRVIVVPETDAVAGESALALSAALIALATVAAVLFDPEP